MEEQSTNDKLRALVDATGLKRIQALALFNRSLGARPISASTWKAFFVHKDSDRFRAVKPEFLEHAEKEFANLGLKNHPPSPEE
jgi:hypothetical protein